MNALELRTVESVSTLMERYLYAFHEEVMSRVEKGEEPRMAILNARATLHAFRTELQGVLGEHCDTCKRDVIR